MKYSPILAPIAGIALAIGSASAADTYNIDPAHTTVGFSIAHLVINTVHGRFRDVAGSITLDPQKSNTIVAASATIQTKSIDTGIARRDDHLRSADFFDAEKYPTMTFTSKRVEVQNGQQILVGDFVMHGVTNPVTLQVAIKGPIKDPMGGGSRIGVQATGTLNRTDYGLKWNRALEAGGVMVGEEVALAIDAEAVKGK